MAAGLAVAGCCCVGECTCDGDCKASADYPTSVDEGFVSLFNGKDLAGWTGATGMYDRVLMKDNHRRLWRGGNPDELDQAVVAARKRFQKLAVEVEVESLRECESALKARPEWIMLDNMSCADMKKCVKLCRGKTKTEASGGITLDQATKVAATGVTAISLGCLTHSAGSVDLSLEWKAV